MYQYRTIVKRKTRPIVKVPQSLRRGRETLEHVKKNWLPINGKLLRQIQKIVVSDLSDEQREDLVGQVKQDPALFLHCAQFAGVLSESGVRPSNPLALLRTLEEEKLQKLFSVSERIVSRHKLSEMNVDRAYRLQHTILSSHAAEAFADKFKLAPDVAFTGAMLRQLGLNLIAWNYPRMLSQARSAAKVNGTEIKHEIKKALGLTPFELGHEICANWQLDPEIFKVFRENDSVVEQAETMGQSKGPGLEKVCDLSELYAQSKDPLTYPKASERWALTRERLDALLDGKTISEIERRASAAIDACAETVSELRGRDSKALTRLPLAKTVETHRVSSGNLIVHPSDVAVFNRCPEEIQKRLRNMYERIEEAQVSLNAIRYLLEQVIPLLGFTNGCLYFLSKADYVLEPALRIGNHPLSDYGPFLKVANNGLEDTLSSRIPIKKEGIGIDGGIVSHIFGAIQNNLHPGILYFEIADEENLDEEFDAIYYFHVVRKALNACLK